MAVGRRLNILGLERVDVPAIRAIESGVAYDFDVVAGLLLAGGKPLVARGFQLLTAGAVGTDAEKLVLRTAGGLILNYQASEAGSVLRVPLDRADETLSPTNPRVGGAFTPGAANYVGLDLTRLPDDATVDTVHFLDDASNQEFADQVPTARTLDYRVVVSTTEFSASPNVAPLWIVRTDASNKVFTLTDARPNFFRLGTGGSDPQVVAPYGWPGTRSEVTALDATIGGDRAIDSLKSWLDAAMTRIWELGGGEFWYSQTSDRNVQLASSSSFSTTGQSYEIVSNNVHWKGLTFSFGNSTAVVNEVADQLTDEPGLTDLADGDCLYVDLDRTQDRTVAGTDPIFAQRGRLASLGDSARPGSRTIFAWRVGANFYARGINAVGGAVRIASTTAVGITRVSMDPVGGWTINDPVAAAVDMSGGDGAATAGGVSHNRDLGATALLPAGDVVVGRGTAAGDDDVRIKVDGGAHAVKVSTATNFSASGQFAGLDVRNSDTDPDSLAQVWRAATGELNAYMSTDGALGTPNATRLPHFTGGSGSADAAAYFTRSAKRWKQNVRLAWVADTVSGFTAAGAGVGKTLTATSNGTLTVDGVSPGTGDRILIDWGISGTGSINSGIYVVTAPGSGSTHWILTRSADCDSTGDAFRSVAVLVTDGALHVGEAYAICNKIDPSSNQGWLTVDTDVLMWMPTTRSNRYYANWRALGEVGQLPISPSAEGSI